MIGLIVLTWAVKIALYYYLVEDQEESIKTSLYLGLALYTMVCVVHWMLAIEYLEVILKIPLILGSKQDRTSH